MLTSGLSQDTKCDAAISGLSFLLVQMLYFPPKQPCHNRAPELYL